MSSTDETATEQCRALTNDGNRCQNPATGDGFCHQHDESDPTVDDSDSETTDEGGEEHGDAGDENDEAATQAESGTDTGGDAGGSDSGASDQDAADEGDTESDAAADADSEADDGSTAQDDADGETEADSGGGADAESGVSVGGAGSLMDVRRTVQEVTAKLIDHPLDSVVEITKVDDEWRATVEVIERRSVPDTQDILGRYELTLDDPQTVTGYRRVSRHRRSDTNQGESVE